MRLIVGLGNPGREYTHTRHNVGFDVLDLLAKRRKTRIIRRQNKALVGSFDSHGEEIMLVKPQTFMNLSGESVAAIVRKYRLDPDSVLVVYDDMDLPPGKLRIKTRGSSGGHRGMDSIIYHLRGSDFPRVKIGIGHGGESRGHVLSRFNSREKPVMDAAIDRAADAIEHILDEGIESAMNLYNRDEN